MSGPVAPSAPPPASARPVAPSALADQVRSALDQLGRFVADSRTRLETLLKESGAGAELDAVRAFIRKPWCVIPKSQGEYWLIVPKWADLQFGWLSQSTDTYNVFVVDRYTQMFGAAPEALRAEIPLAKPVAARIVDGQLLADDATARAVAAHVQREGAVWRVRAGHQFALLADLIAHGAMPFTARPIAAGDLRAWDFKGPAAALRAYQRDAWTEFCARGAVCVTWPPSAGKTVIGCYAIGRLRGAKLIAVPSRTLVDQWRLRIEAWCGRPALDETEIITYQGYEKVKNKKYKLFIAEEAHHLPANSFSRFATIDAEYRLGLSGSPVREDGRTNLVLALTGYPIGVDWNFFISSGLIRPPDIRVRIVAPARKLDVAIEEARSARGRCLVFADSISVGAALAARLHAPHIWGATKDRLGTLGAAPIAVISRVGDEGLSLPDIAKVIEADFHGGSRRQELQRVGRLLHGAGKGEHVIVMTRDEYARFGRRMLAIEERGLRVRVVDETVTGGRNARK